MPHICGYFQINYNRCDLIQNSGNPSHAYTLMGIDLAGRAPLAPLSH